MRTASFREPTPAFSVCPACARTVSAARGRCIYCEFDLSSKAVPPKTRTCPDCFSRISGPIGRCVVCDEARARSSLSVDKPAQEGHWDLRLFLAFSGIVTVTIGAGSVSREIGPLIMSAALLLGITGLALIMDGANPTLENFGRLLLAPFMALGVVGLSAGAVLFARGVVPQSPLIVFFLLFGGSMMVIITIFWRLLTR